MHNICDFSIYQDAYLFPLRLTAVGDTQAFQNGTWRDTPKGPWGSVGLSHLCRHVPRKIRQSMFPRNAQTERPIHIWSRGLCAVFVCLSVFVGEAEFGCWPSANRLSWDGKRPWSVKIKWRVMWWYNPVTMDGWLMTLRFFCEWRNN